MSNQWIVQLVSLILIRWIVIYKQLFDEVEHDITIYPVDSAIQRLNNRGLEDMVIY